MDFNTHVLSNGIKLIHIQADSPVAHCGFFINAGSRDEDKGEYGIAHFIEHLLFKGTQKRKAFHVLSRLEDVGGELNAYTSKEDTCVEASFLKEHYSRVFELISDIVFHSVFPEKAMESEMAVIIDEINSYKDSPSDSIFDDYEERFFQNHPLGRNILGTAKQLKKIKRDDLLSFIERKYHTNKMVFASVGNISFSRLVYLFEKYFGEVPSNIQENKREPFNSYQPYYATLNKHTYQVHAVIGNTGYDLKDPKRMGLHLLSNIIGGPGMISRLNLALRERKGYSYNVESSFCPYSDTGLFTVYFSSDKDYLEKCFEIIEKEFSSLRNKPLGSMQLQKARQQIMGQMAISFESHENQMLSMGKSYLVYDKVESLDEIFSKIEKITASELMDIANEILDKDSMSTLIYK